MGTFERAYIWETKTVKTLQGLNVWLFISQTCIYVLAKPPFTASFQSSGRDGSSRYFISHFQKDLLHTVLLKCSNLHLHLLTPLFFSFFFYSQTSQWVSQYSLFYWVAHLVLNCSPQLMLWEMVRTQVLDPHLTPGNSDKELLLREEYGASESESEGGKWRKRKGSKHLMLLFLWQRLSVCQQVFLWEGIASHREWERWIGKIRH